MTTYVMSIGTGGDILGYGCVEQLVFSISPLPYMDLSETGPIDKLLLLQILGA